MYKVNFSHGLKEPRGREGKYICSRQMYEEEKCLKNVNHIRSTQGNTWSTYGKGGCHHEEYKELFLKITRFTWLKEKAVSGTHTHTVF